MNCIHQKTAVTMFSCICSVLLAVHAQAQEYSPKTVLRRPIRAITDPPITSADKADIKGNELVIGVEVNNQSRAYSINQLTGPRREIINDELGGVAIAATW